MKDKNTLGWIMDKSKKEVGKIIFLIIANMIFSVLTIAFAFAVKVVINGGENQDANLLIYGGIFVVSVIALQFVFRLIINGLSETIKARLEIVFKSHVFSQIFKKQYSQITKHHSGELVNRLTSDVSIVTDGITEILPSLIGSVTRLISAVIALIIIDWIFAVVFLCAGSLVFLIMALLRGKLKGLHKQTQHTEGKTRSFMQECIENLLVIKASNAQKNTMQQADSLQQTNYKVKMKRRNYSVFGHSAYNFIYSAGYVFALIFGAYKLYKGDFLFGYGELSAVLQLVNSVQVPFASLSGIFPRYFAMIASAERLMEIEQIPNDQEVVCQDVDKIYQSLQSIRVENLSFAYDSDLVLNNLSFEIKKGESVALTGVSGIGKSTLMKILLGVYPSDGKAYLHCDDADISISGFTRSMFSYVPQGNMLFSGTLKDNLVLMNPNASPTQIEESLKIACAYDFIDKLPNKLDTVVGENGAGLSEGQIQRIAVARAVLSNAPIMLLDEATSALDKQTEKELLTNILSLKSKTILLISHRKQADSMCDRTLTLNGKNVTENVVK